LFHWGDMSEPLCDYEKQRLKRISDNQQFFRTLGIEKVVEKHIPKKREKKERPTREEPARRSSRLKTEASSSDPPHFHAIDVTVDEHGKEIDPTDTYCYDEEEYLEEWIRKRKNSGKEKKKKGRRNSLGVRIVGNKIYDSENGTTCHQCRQKTMDPKIQCTHFMIVDGTKIACNVMLDENCLFNRYGQTIEQARSTGEWKCPMCLDICNCSFCRRRKGLAPTGIMINRARREGFTSVHDFLAASRKENFKKARTEGERKEENDRKVDSDGEGEGGDEKREKTTSKKEKPLKTKKRKEKKNEEEEEEEGDDVYEVEKILKMTSIEVEGRRKEYFYVKWLGYPERTWEPRENLFCDKMLEAFLAKKKKGR